MSARCRANAKAPTNSNRDDDSVEESTFAGSSVKTGSDANGSYDCSRCKDRPPLCFQCHGATWVSCRRCKGSGELRSSCWCSTSSSGPRVGCRKCRGTGVWVRDCTHCSGQGLWQCGHCKGRGLFPCGACGRGQVPPNKTSSSKGRGRALDLLGTEPPKGLTVTRCEGAEATSIVKLWVDRGCGQKVAAVWSVDNPCRAWMYRRRRAELEQQLGRTPAELRGFHGSSPCNILAIAESGFDAGRRAGQVFGAGEYFAKDPSVSVCYCGGGSYMLVCQLCLGHESSSETNEDGDHIWVPHCGYYVISSPEQVLPLYIVHFRNPYAVGHPRAALNVPGEEELAAKLAAPSYRSGLVDERMIDLDLEIPGQDKKTLRFEARPASWWSGDVGAFGGRLFFDSGNDDGGRALAGELARGMVVVFRRGGGCTFAEKEARARAAGASALLVVQSSGSPLCMTATGAAVGAEPTLPAAMLAQKDGEKLISLASSLGVKLVAAHRRGQQEAVPPNRPCAMSAESTDALWLGFLHPHFSDKQLTSDLRRFLNEHLPRPEALAEVRIVRGKFTQAKVSLLQGISRAEVQLLNSKPFMECGVERTLTVDDAHGSPGQRCPRSIARYCRGQNLRFVDPCWCKHAELPTARATFTMKDVALESAKGDEICSAFLSSAPFHDGQPTVTSIRAVHNPKLEQQHEFFRRYLTEKNDEAPRQAELYHGTNMNILKTVYTHGLFPPSDTEPSEDCPVSGGKGLRTSLCNNDCKFCTKPHSWDRCHMYGLGIYLGDIAQKSHRYVSAGAPTAGGSRECKMVVCSVLLGDALQLEGHLRCCDALHSVQSLRKLGTGDLASKVDLVSAYRGKKPADQRDILFVKGLGCASRPGFSVFNSEFISFHPYQCLPRYEITYLVRGRNGRNG